MHQKLKSMIWLIDIKLQTKSSILLINNSKLKNATNILVDFKHMTKSQTFPKRAIDLTHGKINSQKNSYYNIIDQQ
jgi:hypothetical protein